MVQKKTVLRAEPRDKIRPSEAPPIVAHFRFDIDSAARALALLRRETARLPFESLHRIDIQPRIETAGSRIPDIETVQPVIRFARFAAIKVQLAPVIENRARHEGQRTAIILGRRVQNVENLRAVQPLRIGSLLRIDDRRRVIHVDRLGQLLQMVHTNLE